jgi:hypothetical protein
MLDRYLTINQELCANNSVQYIDTRHPFLAALPPNYYGYQGCLTIDGEHENYEVTSESYVLHLRAT